MKQPSRVLGLLSLTWRLRAVTRAGTWVGRRARGLSAVSMVSNAPPTCCWDVVVRTAQWAAKMSVLTFSSRSAGRERSETSQEVNKWRRSNEEEVTKWRRSNEEEVTIRGSRDGKVVPSGHPAKKLHKPFLSLVGPEDTHHLAPSHTSITHSSAVGLTDPSLT